MTRNEAIALRAAQLQGVPVTDAELREAIAVLSNPTKRGRPALDPWGLTTAQRAALQAVIDHGGDDEAAEAIGCSPRTIQTHIGRAIKQMGAAKRLFALLEWDRFTRGVKA